MIESAAVRLVIVAHEPDYAAHECYSWAVRITTVDGDPVGYYPLFDAHTLTEACEQARALRRQLEAAGATISSIGVAVA